MTTFYVRKSGNDANVGTSPSAAWLTIDRALSASGTMSGDTLYIGSGVYREKITARGSYVTGTFVIGDVAGAYTGDTPGEIRITNFLTNDETTATDQSLIVMNGKSHLTFQNLTLHLFCSTEIFVVDMYTVPNSQYITFLDCSSLVSSMGGSAVSVFKVAHTATTAIHLLVDRMFSIGLGTIYFMDLAVTPASDVDLDVIIRNCFVSGGVGVYFVGLTNKGGGLIIQNCTMLMTAGSPVETFAASTTFKSRVENSVLFSDPTWGYAALVSSGAGQITENYNLIIASTARTNVAAGANSNDNGSNAYLIQIGQENTQNRNARPFWTPTADSPLLGFGNVTGSPTVDILNRPRPAGGGSTFNAVGAYERHDTGFQSTGTYDSPPSSLQLSGPADQDIDLPVNPQSTNISVYGLYDAGHGTGTPPQAIVLANPKIGVVEETLTMSEPTGTWERLEFSTFTPTDYGVVTLRLRSRPATGTGNAWFDTITV